MGMRRSIPIAAWLATLLTSASLAEDVRVSFMGPEGDEEFYAGNPDTAYNSTNDEFLVVWEGNDNAPGLAPFESEIYAVRVSASSGEPLGAAVRISVMGEDGDVRFLAHEPSVAWNSTSNQYIVAWWGDDDSGPLVDDEREVYARLLSSAGQPIGEQTRVSFMGEDGDTLAGGLDPDVVFNPAQGEYYVVWQGDNIDGVTQVDQDFEIFGQRLSALDLSPIGPNRRLSDMGAMDANPSFNAADPRVALNTDENEYLVVWEGDDDAGDTVDGEMEIYGQRVNAATGVETGGNDFRISFLGPVGATDYDSSNAAAVYNPILQVYLVAWNGSDDDNGGVRNDMEIYVQALTPEGELTAPSQWRISAMGDSASTTWWALNPDVSVNPITGDYLVSWRGEDDAGLLVNNEWEIYARRLSELHNESQFRVSRMGPDGDSQFDANPPKIAFDPSRERFLIAFSGNTARPDLAPRETEVFVHLVQPNEVFSNGFE